MLNNIQLSRSSSLTLQHPNFEEDGFKTFLYDNNCPDKKELENFIYSTFSKYYDAQLIHFYPYLFGAYDELKKPYAAVGYRIANEQRLFLEQYIDKPIEDVLSGLNIASNKQNPLASLNRKHIVEIGNLATTKRGSCRKLFQLLTQYFCHSDYQWVVFTATRTVRVALKRMKFEAYPIAPATLNDIESSQQKSWGSYYDQQPIVMAMPINQILPPSLNQLSMQAS